MRLLSATLLIVSACQTPTAAGTSDARSLYDRLGGRDALAAVVDSFTARVAGDARINRFFAKTDIPEFKKQLTDQLCAASGGPCKYEGASMKEVHKDMGVSNADFDALVEDLVATLDEFKVGQREKDEVLAALGPMRADVVEKP